MTLGKSINIRLYLYTVISIQRQSCVVLPILQGRAPGDVESLQAGLRSSNTTLEYL